jgi:hypothetical protein
MTASATPQWRLLAWRPIPTVLAAPIGLNGLVIIFARLESSHLGVVWTVAAAVVAVYHLYLTLLQSVSGDDRRAAGRKYTTTAASRSVPHQADARSSRRACRRCGNDGQRHGDGRHEHAAYE